MDIPIGQEAGVRSRQVDGWSLDLRADPAEVWKARDLADRAARAWGLDETARFNFTFAANEAVSNAVEHGAPSTKGTIEVWTTCSDRSLCFFVRDYGCLWDRSGHEDTADRGRGLALMAALVDDCELRSDGSTTTARVCTS